MFLFFSLVLIVDRCVVFVLLCRAVRAHAHTPPKRQTREPHNQIPSPPHHYALTLDALALGPRLQLVLLGHDDGDEAALEAVAVHPHLLDRVRLFERALDLLDRHVLAVLVFF